MVSAMKKLFVIAASAALCFAACTQAELVNPESAASLQGNFTLTAAHEGAVLSKTVLQNDGAVLWKNKDKIKLVWNGGAVASNPLSLDAPAASATFTATLPDGAKPVYAVYPSNVTASYDGTNFLVTIPAAQSGAFSDAAIEVLPVGEGSQFKNLAAILKFTIATDVSAISIFAYGDAKLAGKYSVTFEEGVPVLTPADATVSAITVDAVGADTYYVAVATEALQEGLYIEFGDGANITGQKFTGSDLQIGRGQIIDLGTIDAAMVTGKFVTPAGAGTKDGSSWDNAWSVSELLDAVKNTVLTGDVFLAGGTYNVNGPTVKAGSNFHMYGGYDPASTGVDLSRRNIKKYETIIDGQETQRHFVWNNTTSDDSFDGITFQNAYKSSTDVGCSIIANNCKALSFNNCVFKNNRKESSGGGTMRVAKGNIKFTNCEFTGNTAAGNASVFAVTGAATLTLENCIFAGNTAGGSASALYLVNAAYTVMVNHCYFLNNTSGNKGVICAGHQDGKLYMNGCAFSGNTTGDYASVLYAKGKTAVLNCCFDGNTTTPGTNCPATIWTDVNIKDGNPVPAYTLIANSTVRLSQSNAFGVLVDKSPVWAVNSIVNHTAAADSAALRLNDVMTSYGHNLCSSLTQKAPETYVLQDNGHIDILPYTLNQTAEDGILTWSNWNGGTRPTGFTYATSDRVLAAIEAFDAAAGTAVKDLAVAYGFVGEDIRGVKRNPTAFWPGSYDAGATITLP